MCGEKMKVFLINPPRYYWPYLSEGDNYILPQALPCLAAVLRENDIDVKPIDCLPLKIGWKSLKRMIEREMPDVIGVCTSESMFTPEGIKLCRLVKNIDKKIVTVAGGAHFSNLVDENLKNHPIDFIVIGEGEYTLLELVKEIEKPKSKQNFKKVKGIAFKTGKKLIKTKPRPLIKNLDELPFPAYDLMPMKEYGKEKFLFSPGGTTIHHSRGCVHNCKFCIWWVQMSQRRIEKGREICYPRWRTKSVEKTLEEMELLRYKYKKKYLEFVDDTWNVDLKWNNAFANEIKERGLDVNWFAFMRADYILRDERLGIFKTLVDSGLVRVCIGAERAVTNDLSILGKGGYNTDVVKKCFHLMRNKYPQIFRQATFITGMRNETKESMMKLLEYTKELDPDFPSFHPLTPIPGTDFWKEAIKNNWIEEKDFGKYDWLTPIISSEKLSRKEIFDLTLDISKKYINLRWFLRGLFAPSKYKRNMYLWWLFISLRIVADEIKDKILLRSNNSNNSFYTKLMKPKWYDN